MNAAIRRSGLVLVAVLLSPTAGADDALKVFAEEARKVATQLVTQVRGELTKELERTGPIRAITVCKYSVPELSSNISRHTGWRVTRVALRARNGALGQADAWEQKVLLDFERAVAKGEKVDTLEYAEAVSEPAGKALRYMKAIPMQPPCLACHGPVDQLSEGVRAQLATEYPYDKAVDYSLGQVRGAVSVKKFY